MSRKFFNCALILFAILTIVACEKLLGPGPDKVLNNYLNSSLGGRYKESYFYISAKDKAVKDLQSYCNENDKKDNLFANFIFHEASYRILKLEKSGKTARADVEIMLPDSQAILADVRGSAFSSALRDGDKEEIERIITKKYESDKVPLSRENETFELVKEKEGWKVFLDWRTEKIQSLMAEAKALKESKELEKARDTYEKALKLDAGLVEAQKEIKDIQIEIKKREEKQSIINNCVLYDLKSKYYETFLDKNVPGVKFKIKNKNNRTLKKVEVTVYFKDRAGKTIAERTFYPLTKSKYTLRGETKPLKSNGIWQMERGDFFTVDSIPRTWKEGAVFAKITNIEVEE
ncbi:MAG: hypothetical protein ACMUIP_01485 [bacterium]